MGPALAAVGDEACRGGCREAFEGVGSLRTVSGASDEAGEGMCGRLSPPPPPLLAGRAPLLFFEA